MRIAVILILACWAVTAHAQRSDPANDMIHCDGLRGVDNSQPMPRWACERYRRQEHQLTPQGQADFRLRYDACMRENTHLPFRQAHSFCGRQ